MVQAGDVSLSLSSKYLGSISGGVCYDGPVIQADHAWMIDSKTYVGLWGSIGLAGDIHGSNSGNELDLYVGTAIGKLDVGLNYYDMGNLDETIDDCLAIYVNAPLGKVGDWKANFHAEYDISMDKRLPDGNMYRLAIERPIGKDTLRVNIGGHLKSWGVAAEPISFYGLEYIKPLGRDTDLKVRGHIATHTWGQAQSAMVVSIAQKISL